VSFQVRQGFWHEAFAIQGAVSSRVLGRVLLFGLVALGGCVLAWIVEWLFERRFALVVTPHELAGAALAVLLVMRTNAGYERWWEARKLWGGFVDRCRNVCIGALAYGPVQPEWRRKVVRWVAAYPHVARHCLRGETPSAEVVALVGQGEADRIGGAAHMPSYMAWRLGGMLREARDGLGMDGFAFMQVDHERALLITNYGGCERILNTPLPRVYSIKIRHLLALYLLTLPFALLHQLQGDWLVPIVTMMVAYPLLSLDQIGVELENPFSEANLSHLPIDGISAAIERNMFGLLEAAEGEMENGIKL
jgi:putative membrane protein